MTTFNAGLYDGNTSGLFLVGVKSWVSNHFPNSLCCIFYLTHYFEVMNFWTAKPNHYFPIFTLFDFLVPVLVVLGVLLSMIFFPLKLSYSLLSSHHFRICYLFILHLILWFFASETSLESSLFCSYQHSGLNFCPSCVPPCCWEPLEWFFLGLTLF